jgi:hypothetical protein
MMNYEKVDILLKTLDGYLSYHEAIIASGPECDCEPEGHVCGWPRYKRATEALRLAFNATSEEMKPSVFAVIFSNYFPRQVDSLWETEALAQRRADELGDGWDVEGMEVGKKKRIEEAYGDKG